MGFASRLSSPAAQNGAWDDVGMDDMERMILVSDIMSGQGGTEFVIAKTLKLLKKKYQVESSVFLHGKDKTSHFEWLQGLDYQIELTNVRNHKLQQLQTAWRLAKIIRQYKPDCIVAVTPISIYISHLARLFSRLKTRIISWAHINIDYKKKYFTLADSHLAISTGIHRRLVECGIPADRIALVFNPVSNSDMLIPRPAVSRFLYLGRVTFEGQKCLKDLLEATRDLSGEWLVDIVGGGEDVERCQRYAKELGVSDHFIWHGWQQDPWGFVAERIEGVTSLVQCSSYEGFPLVLIEALMRGVSCIASDCESGPEDIIEHGVNGFLFKPHDINALRSLMQQLIDGDEMPSAAVLKKSVAKYEDDNFTERFYLALCQFTS